MRYCSAHFDRHYMHYKSKIKQNKPFGLFCSNSCAAINRNNIRKKPKERLECIECGNIVLKFKSHVRDTSKFCSYNCKGRYQQKNKNWGSSVSKLEQYLQNKLITLYPDIGFCFNDRKLFGYELDIYIPELKLAFELNGIFHFKDVYGNLEKVQKWICLKKKTA